MKSAWKIIEDQFPWIQSYGCAAHGLNLVIIDVFAHNDDEIRIKINFGCSQLEWFPSVKYLGVILKTKLLLRQDIENNFLSSKSMKLFPLVKKFIAVPLKEKITRYRSYIRPILTYACSAL
jgi:hypothetical protein